MRVERNISGAYRFAVSFQARRCNLQENMKTLIRRYYIPSGNIPLRKAQMELNRTHFDQKEKR